MSLRLRLLAGTLLLLVAGLVVADVTAYVVLERHLDRRLDRTLDVAEREFESERAGTSTTLSPDAVAAVAPAGLLLELRGEDGAVLLATGPAGVDPDEVEERRIDLAADTDVRLAMPEGGTERVASVVLGVSTADNAATLRTLLVVEVVAGLAIVLVGGLLAWWVLGAGLRPLRRIAEAAGRIERGADERVPAGPPGTETHDLAVALDRAFAARTRSEAGMRTFLADASHELRTPLTAVQAWADLHAAGALPDEADVAEAMRSIGAEGARMRDLVEQLLVLARLDAGWDGPREEVDLVALARESVTALAVLAGPRLHGPTRPDPVPVVGDPAALRRVVDNLVVNALRHTPPDTRVEVAVEGGERPRLTVADAGPGLTPEERARAFDRFWRAAPGRDRGDGGGSGLGLAIARDIAREHGGDLSLATADLGGLRVTLDLPALSRPSGSPPPPDGSRDPGRSGSWGVLRRMLTVPLRRPWTVVALWLIGVVAVLLLARAYGGAYDNDIDLPGTQASAGADLLAGTGSDGVSAKVVLYDPDGLADDASALDAVVADLEAVDGVLGVAKPLAPGTVSADGTTSYLALRLAEPPRSLDESTLDGIEEALAPLDVEVSYAGPLGDAIEPGGHARLPELIGVVTALVMLLLLFGSVLGALTPLLTAALGVAGGLGLLGLLAATTTLATTAPTLATMIGLGCGIDYALFVVTRARQHLLDGAEVPDAVGRALRSSGHAVLVAGATVAVSLLGLYASGISFVGRLGLAATVALATAMLAAVTLVPAVLVLLGRRIDRLRVRRPVAEVESGTSRWTSYSRWVARHAVAVIVGATALLLVLAVPLLSMRLGHVDEGADPVGSTTRTAYDRIEAGFGPGANGTFTAVVETGADLAATRAAIAGVDGVAAVTPFVAVEGDTVATATVTPATDPQDAATGALVGAVNEVAPEVVLTGSTVAQVELGQRVTERLPLIIALVVVAAFALLTVTFRSPVVALKAAVMNLVSIGASYGVLVAVFQWGWGAGVLGVDEAVPIESFVPMMMFAIVFGLSMDYEVFLLSRVRERWLATGDTTRSVAEGLASTARVISAAAIVMVSVFLAFALEDDVTIKMLAVGLAVSVAIDATVVRLLLVPATMVVLGGANWWAPGWLGSGLSRARPRAPRARRPGTGWRAGRG